MTQLSLRPALASELDRLHPFLRTALQRAAAFAARFHADELTTEHLFASLLEDEESALTQTVLHAFADPETIAVEAVALAPGIMVVSSDRCIPFSARGVDVLEAARTRAAERRHADITPAHLLQVSFEALEEELAGALREAGWSGAALDEDLSPSEEPVPAEGPVLRRFDQDARRAMSAAGRVADRLERGEISPAHLVVGCLEVGTGLEPTSGLTATRARLALSGRDEDRTPLPERSLEVEDELLEHLAGLPEGGGSADLLARWVQHGTDELRALLARQKITPALLEHATGAFEDPADTG